MQKILAKFENCADIFCILYTLINVCTHYSPSIYIQGCDILTTLLIIFTRTKKIQDLILQKKLINLPLTSIWKESNYIGTKFNRSDLILFVQLEHPARKKDHNTLYSGLIWFHIPRCLCINQIEGEHASLWEYSWANTFCLFIGLHNPREPPPWDPWSIGLYIVEVKLELCTRTILEIFVWKYKMDLIFFHKNKLNPSNFNGQTDLSLL